MIITGDLWDHQHNLDPTTLKSNLTGKLWEALYVDKVSSVQARNKEFPCGIDGLAVYSLLVDFYTQHSKPVFITSGNHEAYEYPYGISPRIGKKRANDGIAMDHNLTFYEAILLYGPAYKNIVPELMQTIGSSFTCGLLGGMNFNSQNFDWFCTVFTPFVDFWQTFKSQTIIGLGWGDGEDYLWNPTPLPGLDEGGLLPRASKSVSKEQKSLVEAALQQNSRDTIFCSHFTVVNYATDTPLSATGQVATVNYGFSKFEYGAAKDGRTHLHGDWIRNNRFSLTLSGHSHRAGLYKCQFVPSREIVKAPYPQFASPDSKEYIPEHLKTQGYHPGSDGAKAAAWGGQTRVLVSASTGPVSKQNREGEMIGYGMEHPAGSRITTDGVISLVNSRDG